MKFVPKTGLLLSRLPWPRLAIAETWCTYVYAQTAQFTIHKLPVPDLLGRRDEETVETQRLEPGSHRRLYTTRDMYN
jgi:hypothetical protein